jgi:hypothetical protein
MDPITAALFNLGAGGVIAGVMYAVLLQFLKDFKEEQAALREAPKKTSQAPEEAPAPTLTTYRTAAPRQQ